MSTTTSKGTGNTTEAGGHTPGPWICSSHDFVRTQKGDAIACVYSGNDSEDPGKNIEAEAANARLIASAPSLLAELSALKASNAALVEALKNALPFVRMRANRNEGGVLDREQDLATVTEHEIRALLASVKS